MNRSSRVALVLLLILCATFAGFIDDARAQTKPEGEMRWALLHQIQQLVHDRVRLAPIWEYTWPSGIGPRVAEPALMLINPYPWSAPLEDVRLKK